MRTARLSKDDRTGIWRLRRRIPRRYLAVADQPGGMVKITTGTADRKLAESRLPDVLHEWEVRVAEWERRLNVVALTPEKAREVAAQWAASVGDSLDADGCASDVFEPLDFPEEATPERVARMWDVIERHADDAVRVAGISITPDTRPGCWQRWRGPSPLPTSRPIWARWGCRSAGNLPGYRARRTAHLQRPPGRCRGAM